MADIFSYFAGLLANIVYFISVDTLPLFGGLFSLGSFLVTIFLLRLAIKYILIDAGSEGS